jgi:hypothetical protein
MINNKAEHSAYIESPYWHSRRARYFKGHRRACRACGTAHNIQLHHLDYARAGRGKEPDTDLCPLCGDHHLLAHTYEKSGRYGRPFSPGTLRLATASMIRDVQHGQRPTPSRPPTYSPSRGAGRYRKHRFHWGLLTVATVIGWAAGVVEGWWTWPLT